MFGFGRGFSGRSYPRYNGAGFVPGLITAGLTGLLVSEALDNGTYGNPYLYPYGQPYPMWLLASQPYNTFYNNRARGIWSRWR